MNVFTIQKKNIIINDDEIYHRIVNNKIEYVHFFLVEDTGGFNLIAKQPDGDELTLGKNYKRIVLDGGNMYIRTPKNLISHAGKKVWYYTERLYPESGELFRIKPINFNLGKLSTKLQNEFDPYFTDGNNLVLPHHYLNTHVDHAIINLKISFLRSTKKILSNGYVFISIVDQNIIGFRKMLYFLEKRNHYMRTKPVLQFMEYLKLHGKNINNYEYKCTLTLESCKYGMIVFKEM